MKYKVIFRYRYAADAEPMRGTSTIKSDVEVEERDARGMLEQTIGKSSPMGLEIIGIDSFKKEG